MDINDLRRMLKAAADDMQIKAKAIEDLEAADTPDGDAIKAAVTEFEASEADFKKVQVKLTRAQSIEDAKAATATSELEAVTAPQAAPAAAANPEEKGIEIGFMAHALINAKGDRDKAVESLEKDGHSAVSAALSGASEGAGGVTLPRPQATQVIELLRPRVTVRASGAVVHDLPAGELRNARQATPASASYGGENAAMVESEPTFDKVEEKFRKLTSLVPVGNSLLRHSSASIAIMVRNDILREMGLKNDLAFLRFDGSGVLPKGLRHWALADHWEATVGKDPAVVEQAIRRIKSKVEDANVAMVAPGWIMRASAKNFLGSLRWPNGFKVFPSIDDNGTLHGFPIKVTSQIPDNLGVGGDETEVYFADFAEIMIGDALQITFGTSSEAAYVNQAGDTVSAWAQDLTLMRAIAEHDMAPMHDEAIAGLNGVGWSL
ncbi:phage major capsid protein, HK97 family (plasmid) [Phaeobacter inhibens]|uniref:Phage major capsid protein, HK97 family n=1 Tax=Phaeobacter inhibens TaxID=221822 RepID=A0ABN5GLZ7_9RHOB|nr:phage major capsid protein [Phaeobacter inhibens]AUQ93856.1 phage major capsid protein, HK97 family [Phaeobacter inhibens]AUQ97401.1 phage major capsid protein, HK97 family [Phaeobacter inhibens]